MKDEPIKEKVAMKFSTLKPKGLVALGQKDSGLSFTKTQIQTALNNRTEKDLRRFSQYFYIVSGEYRRLVEYYGKLYTQNFMTIPRVAAEDIASPGFASSLEAVKLYMQNASLAETNIEIATLVVRDGAFYGYERDIDGTIVMQQLPVDYCRTRFKAKGVLVPEFDMSYFDRFRTEAALEEQLGAFPKEFRKYYMAYKKDTQNARWVLLDPQYARAHVMWEGLPLLSPIFLDLIELKEYKEIEKLKSTLDIYKVLIQKIPVNKDGEVTLMLPEIQDLHDNFRVMISNNNIDVITTPAEVDLIDLADKNQGLSDDISKAKDIIYTSAGTSSALFHSGSKTGSIGLEASIKTDEALMYPLLKQFEKWYELKLSSLSKGISYGVTILPITVHNRKEMFTLYKDAAAMGYPTKVMTCVSLGINQFDEDFLLNYENIFLNLPERMIPTSSSYTATEDGETPESDDPLTDEGQRTRDGNKNKNRA